MSGADPGVNSADAPPYLVPHTDEEIEILYEDEHLLLVRKPHLLLSIPGRHPLNRDSLILRLRECYPSASIVHRLDLDTSGVMVIPLDKAVHSAISRQFQERRVWKIYDAVVAGRVETDEGEIDLPIAADWERRPRQKICHKLGKAALTHYRVISREADRSRLSLQPVTGRSHQLRLHMREIGHPVLGCDLYAPASVERLAPRLLLNASRLGLQHPVTGEWLEGACDPGF